MLPPANCYIARRMPPSLLDFWPVGVACLLLLSVAWLMSRRPTYKTRGAADDAVYCAACGYDISHLPAETCPECGSDLTAVGRVQARWFRVQLWSRLTRVSLFLGLAIAVATVSLVVHHYLHRVVTIRQQTSMVMFYRVDGLPEDRLLRIQAINTSEAWRRGVYTANDYEGARTLSGSIELFLVEDAAKAALTNLTDPADQQQPVTLDSTINSPASLDQIRTTIRDATGDLPAESVEALVMLIGVQTGMTSLTDEQVHLPAYESDDDFPIKAVAITSGAGLTTGSFDLIAPAGMVAAFALATLLGLWLILKRTARPRPAI